MKKIIFYSLLIILGSVSFSSAEVIKKMTKEESEGALSIADSRTFVTHYKHEKKYKALVKLLTDELTRLDTICATPKSICDYEGKLYIYDDLADIYTYGLIDFQKAREFNEKTRETYEFIRAEGIESQPVSTYFNANRFLYYSFYASDAFNSDEESMTFAFDDDYVDNVRQYDFDDVMSRVAQRHVFLSEKLGAAPGQGSGQKKKQVMNADLFRLYAAFIDSSSGYSGFEKAFLKAKMAAEALSKEVPADQLFINTIVSSKLYTEGVYANNSYQKQDKINRLNYWLTLAYLKRGQKAEALQHHELLVSGISAMEKAQAKKYKEMAKLLKSVGGYSEGDKARAQGKEFFANLAGAGVFLIKAALSAAAMAGDTALSVGTLGEYKPTMTNQAYENMWEGQDWDSGVSSQIMASDFMGPIGGSKDASKRFSKFMTPYTLLLNRYLNKYELAIYMVAIGDAYAAQHQLDKAVTQYAEAIQITERQRLTIYSESERMAYFGFKQALYAKMITALLEKKKTSEALEYVERSKSRAFLDILGGGQVQLKSKGQDSLAQNFFQNRAEVDSMLENKSVGINQVIYAKKNSLRGLEVVSDAVVDNSFDEIYSLSSVSVLETRKIQKLIDKKAAILEYYLTDDTLNIIVIRRNGVHNVSVPVDYKQLTEDIRTLRQSIVSLRYNRKLARKLHGQLIEPVAEYLKCNRLIVIPHKALHYLPFQALMKKNKYMIQEYAISYVPSATALSIVNKKSVGKNAKALIISNPTGDLKYSEKEAKAIGETLPNADVVLGAQGTETLLKNGAGEYSIIHIASHGVFDPEKPLASRLKLHPSDADDGNLMTDELFSCRWRASLVTLSACETGMSKLSSGDELIGLQRGIFFAGTQSLLASSWKVDDKSTSYLMTRFYTHLERYPKDMALQKAQSETIKKYGKPFYWASFRLMGSSNRAYTPEYPLTLNITPDDGARPRIVLVGAGRTQYKPGVRLSPGQYELYINKRGYKRKKLVIEIEYEPVVIDLELKKLGR